MDERRLTGRNRPRRAIMRGARTVGIGGAVLTVSGAAPPTVAAEDLVAAARAGDVAAARFLLAEVPRMAGARHRWGVS